MTRFMSDSKDAPVLYFEASEGSEFRVALSGSEGIDDVVSVRWRGIDLCADCFIDALDPAEREELVAWIRARSV